MINSDCELSMGIGNDGISPIAINFKLKTANLPYLCRL